MHYPVYMHCCHEAKQDELFMQTERERLVCSYVFMHIQNRLFTHVYGYGLFVCACIQ